MYTHAFSDGTTAADNFAALQNFFDQFPEYASNDFYVAGESYGVYSVVLSQNHMGLLEVYLG